eukprot:gene19447-26107_t
MFEFKNPWEGVHKQKPSLPRGSFSHMDNSGGKALVKSICRQAANNNRTTSVLAEECFPVADTP